VAAVWLVAGIMIGGLIVVIGLPLAGYWFITRLILR
jgi:hypothetical protein